MAFCSVCGSQLPDAARFCPSCGATAQGGFAPDAPTAIAPSSHPTPWAAAGSPPVGPRSRNAGCGKTAAIGCGAIIAMVLLFAIIGAIISDFNQSTSTESRSPAPPVRAMRVASLNPRGAYVLRSHFPVPACGGYTDRIEVRSQRHQDIPTAFHRWLAINKPSADQCVSVYVYGDHQSYETDADDNASEAQIEAASPAGFYQNSPGVEEVWVDANQAGTQLVFWNATKR